MLESPASIIHYPTLPMARYGLVPDEYGGGPKYRIIWAPSRMVTLVREITITIPLYYGPQALEPIGEAWVVEEWKPPFEVYRGTEEDWNADPVMLCTGPYPRRGDWVLREALSCNPCEASIEKLISWLEAGGKRRQIENTEACVANLEKAMRDKKSKRDAMVRDMMRPWGAESYAAAGGGRNSKTYPLLKSREELGLPDEGVTKAMRVKNPVTYEVMTA
jgi:hypothetical protein